MYKIDSDTLRQRQGLDLEVKVRLTENRIRSWYDYWKGNVYVSFSGGKDSTVLLHIARSVYKNIDAVFINTGLEYPEILSFVGDTESVTWLKPSISFREVLDKYGFPVISKENAQKICEIRNSKSAYLVDKRLFGDHNGNGKLPNKWHKMIDAPFKISHKCCDVMKKSPARKYEKDTNNKPIIAIMASDSSMRRINYMRKGCNSFESNRPVSNPMSFWLEQDIWDYIHSRNVPYSSIYDLGYERTGCVFCMFGAHLENSDTSRFKRMKKTHPNMYKYCMNKLGLDDVLNYMGIDH